LICGGLAGFLLLGKTTDHWESALENKLSIEIPAEDADGAILSKEALQGLAEESREALQSLGIVQSVEIMSVDEIQSLVEPWLGSDIILQDFPLPVLLTVELDRGTSENVSIVRKRLEKISPLIRIDQHESWLESVMALTGRLQMSALLVIILISAVTVVAIAGAVRMRMALHKSDVELLHLMGANDRYITKQFQHHAFMLAVRGSLIGVAVTVLAMVGLQVFVGAQSATAAAFLRFGTFDYVLVIALPLVICMVATLSAKYTVLRALGQMP